MCSRNDHVRLFFALFPRPAVRGKIIALQQQLGLDGRPVAADHLHLTLAFLGNVPSARLDELRTLAEGLHMPASTLRLDHIAGFDRAGVAYLAAKRVPEALRSFQRAVVERVSSAGFPVDERPWRPHLTLYRKMRKPCRKIPVEAVAWSPGDWCLVASRLEPEGPVYRVLGCWRASG